MGILFKKMIRDLRKAKGQFISILIIVALGVMFYTGMNATFRNLSEGSEKYYREYRMGDLWIDFYKAPESVIQRVNALPYVKMSTGRIVSEVKLFSPGEHATARLITIPDIKRDIVNNIVIKTGQYFSNGSSNQCLVEEEFFKAHGLKLGDTISSIISGNEVKLKVVGAVKSPEYVYILKENGQMLPDHEKFGILYIKNSFGQAIFDYNASINNISLLLKDGTDIDYAKEDIKKVLGSYGVASVIDREGQLSSSMISQEIKGLQSIGGVFPIIFFIVAAVIIYIMMSRTVENQRTQIGVLKALGYTNAQVLVHYLSYSVFIGVVGSIFGAVAGMYLGIGYTGLMNMYFHLPPADMKIYPDLVIPASLLTMFFCLLSGYNSCKLVFRITPSEAMRQKAPKKGKKVFVERVGILWNNLSYSWKIILRNIFRNKRRALMTSVGIIFSSAIVFVTFGMIDSMNYMMDQQYKNIQNYDIKVTFSKFLNDEEISSIGNLPHVSRLEPVVETGVELSNGWRKKDVGFTALVNSPQMYKVTDTNGNQMNVPKRGILIPEKLAMTLGAKVGDSVYLKFFYPGTDKREVPIRGIVAQYMGVSAYSSIESMNYLLGEGMIANGAVIKLDSIVFEEEVKERLNEMNVVSSVQSQGDAFKSINDQMATSMSFMYMMIVLAAVLAIAVVYNITTINILERQRELATLKVLGFMNGEVKKLIFDENYLITAFGIVLGLPLGQWMGSSMMKMSESDSFTISFITGTETYLVSIALTVLFTFLANHILMKKIKSVDMVEVLKSIE